MLFNAQTHQLVAFADRAAVIVPILVLGRSARPEPARVSGLDRGSSAMPRALLSCADSAVSANEGRLAQGVRECDRVSF